ncbi:hypothetical protein KR067_002059, partial [Drosophila pandora]
DAAIFKFTNVACETYNKSWVTFSQCRLKAVSRDRVFLNIRAYIYYPAHRIMVRGKIFKRANGYKPWLYDKKVDACAFIRQKSNPLVLLVYNLFKDFSNINHTCPYEGEQVIKDFYLQQDLLRVPLPSGDYMLTLQWYFDKKPQFDTNVSFSFVENIIS